MCFTVQLKYMTITYSILYNNSILPSPTVSLTCLVKFLAYTTGNTCLLVTFTANNCGQLWHAYKSGCLRLFKDRKDWDAANQHCATFNTPGGGNGRLILIFSQNDNERIVNLRSSLGFPQGMVSHYSLRL